MTDDERKALWAEVRKMMGMDQPATPEPLPPGVDRAALDPANIEKVSDTWVASLLARDAHTLTPAERQGLRQAIQRALEQGVE